MWNVRGARLFGPVMCLAVALVLFGASQLDAKKPPKPPEVQWQVAIPNEGTELAEGMNLYGYGTPDEFGYVTFENVGAVEVDVFTNVDPETKAPYTVFTLTIAEPGSIGFQGLEFQGCRTYCSGGGEGPCRCQVLPNADPEERGVDCCDVLQPGCRVEGAERTGYEISKEFMEGSLHPTGDYDHFSLRFIVHTDIESIDDTWSGDVDLVRLNLWNTDEILVDGDEENHNIVCAYWIPLEDVVIERLGADEWTVTVDQCGLPAAECQESKYGHTGRWVIFWETYYQGILKPIGKSGNFSLDSEYRWAMGSGTPFKFVTKWTRY